MKSTKRILLIFALMVTCGVYSSDAQVYVRVRPARPHYERVVAPSPRHVWIDEEWEPRSGSYVFVGGRWAEPPHPHFRWVPGHWKATRHGDIWVPGHWRRR
jgi:WXXGXW repeat (2 copies)